MQLGETACTDTMQCNTECVPFASSTTADTHNSTNSDGRQDDARDASTVTTGISAGPLGLYPGGRGSTGGATRQQQRHLSHIKDTQLPTG